MCTCIWGRSASRVMNTYIRASPHIVSSIISIVLTGTCLGNSGGTIPCVHPSPILRIVNNDSKTEPFPETGVFHPAFGTGNNWVGGCQGCTNSSMPQREDHKGLQAGRTGVAVQPSTEVLIVLECKLSQEQTGSNNQPNVGGTHPIENHKKCQREPFSPWYAVRIAQSVFPSGKWAGSTWAGRQTSPSRRQGYPGVPRLREIPNKGPIPRFGYLQASRQEKWR